MGQISPIVYAHSEQSRTPIRNGPRRVLSMSARWTLTATATFQDNYLNSPDDIYVSQQQIKTKNALNIVLMIAAFIASWYFKVSSIVIILLFIALGIALTLMDQKKEANV